MAWCALAALLCVCTPALAEITEGSYTGDGANGRTISGVGFQPRIVIVKGQGSVPAVIRVGYMAAGSSKTLTGAASVISDAITDFTADGFVIANGAAVNAVGNAYEWIAFSDDPGDLFTGYYTGNGVAGQYYYGLGFQPDMMIILPHDDEPCQVRTIDMPDDESTTFGSDGLMTNRIRYFVVNGFRVGNDPSVNQFGRQYGLIAWRQNSTKFEHGTYTGDGNASQSISGLGFGPEWVLVKSAESRPAIHRPRSLGNPWSAYFLPQGHIDEGITNLSANHFTVGDNNAVNAAGETYYWAAFNANNRSADLAVTIGADDTTPDEGQEITLQIRATNNGGPNNASLVTIQVDLAPGLTYTGDTPGAGSYDNATGIWTLGDLDLNDDADLLITATVDAGTAGQTLSTRAAVAGMAESDPAPLNNEASVDLTVNDENVDLAIAAVFDAATANLGDTVDLTVTVTNNGPGDSSWFGATVVPPGGLAYQSHTASVGTFDDGPGSWLQPLPLAVGASETLVITYLVTGVDAGPVEVAMAVSGPGPDPVAANDDFVAAIDLVGSFDFAPAVTFAPASANAGDVVTMRVLMANAGPGRAPDYVATITPPGAFVYLDHTASTGAYVDGTGLWTVADSLAVLATDTLAIRFTTPAGGSGPYTGTAAVQDTPGDVDQLNNSDDGTMTLTPVADLSVSAGIDPGTAWPGDAATLTVTIANAGAGAATDPSATVTLPADLIHVAHVAEVGAFDPDTGVWSLAGALASGASRVLTVDLTVGPSATGSLAGSVTVADATAFDPQLGDNTAAFALTVGDAVPIEVEALPLAASERTLLPGGATDDVLRLQLTNTGTHDEILTGLTIHNPVTGGVDQATQDGYWSGLELRSADDDLLGTGVFTAGVLAFTGLGLDLAAGDSIELTVGGAADLWAPDGVELRPSVSGAGDLEIPGLVDLQGTWPLVAPGYLAIDGMTAAQIALHEIGAEIFQIGSVRNLALDVTLPGNGGMADELIKLNVVNFGNAAYPQVITRVEAWADDGDGAFDPAADTRIGDLHWTGGQRYEVSGLSQPVSPAGLRVFVTVDVAEDALGGSVRLSLPAGDDVGVGMLSGNDGPIDAAVTNALAQTVSATDRVIVTTAPIASRPVAPGEERVPLLHLVARNLYTDLRTVRRLHLSNVTTGAAGATQPDLDGTLSQLVVQSDGDGDGVLDGPDIDPIVASTTWENGEAVFESVRWILDPDEVSHLFVSGSVDLWGAADGDSLGAVVGTAGDIMFQETTVVVGDWPLDSDVRYVVDGMVADQVACPAVPPVSLTADEGPVLAFDLTVPGNGYLDDTLETLRLENLGTAVPADIAALGLYDDQNGNGIFEPGTDPLLTSLSGIGQDWIALDVDLAVPAAGRRLFAGLTVASTPTDSATVRLSVPVGGLLMTSANDGPYDAAVVSPTSLLMSTAPLLSNISFDLTHSTTEMTVTATMRVQNVGGEDVVDISPRNLAITGDGSVSLVSGPVPATLDLAQGATGTFTWVLSSDSQGPVYLTARCEGTSAIGGQPRGSLASSSGAHVVLDPALDLDLYPVANMPFSINRGQTGVVPMTLTLLNSGGPDRADLRLEQLVVTLDDGDGNPVIPADLFAHVTVNEGVNVYCDRWSLEPSGQTMTLALNPPVVVTDSEPVTLGLRLDIRADTAVDRFRVVLQSAGDLTVVDNVSGLPRTVQLSGETFPVMSATGSIVSQASGLLVTAPPQPDISAGAGQDDVTLLRLELTSSGDDSASEVKVGGFAVTITDTLGQAVPDAAARLSRIWVEGPLAVHTVQDLTGPADSLVVFELLPQVTVPVDTPVSLTVHGRLPVDPVLGPLRLRLQPAGTFDARDGNNAAEVLVTYVPGQIDGPVVTIEAPAPAVLLAVTGALPPVISLGTPDVLAMNITVEHPGPVNTASVRLDSLRLTCLGIDRQPQDPDAILDGYRVFWNGMDLAVPVFYQNQQLVIPLGGRELSPLSAGVLTVRLDIEAAAPAGGFELVASPSCLIAIDVNLDLPVPLLAAPGRSLPATSGLARLQPPSDDVVAGWLDRLPPLLPTGTTPVEALHLVLTNPAPVGAAPVELTTLVLRAADRRGAPLATGAMLAGVTLEANGEVWAELDDPAASDSTLSLSGPSPLVLAAGGEVELVVKVTGRDGTDADGLSLGIEEADVICVQPGSTTPVIVRPVAGQSFPFWTAAAGLGAAALADSYINFPNPFAAGRDETRFAFNLSEPATVSLRIWTPRGESVTTLLSDEALASGLYQDLAWDGRNGKGQAVRNGVYVAELKVQYESGASERLLRKVAVVR